VTECRLVEASSTESSYRIKYVSEGKRGRKIVDDYVEIVDGFLVVAQGEDKEGDGGEVGKVIDGIRIELI